MLSRIFRHDFFSSLVVFLIAVPLSMGLAVASGAPISSGLIAAAVGGTVVSLLGGAPLVVSGPTATLAVLVFDLTGRYGFATTGAIVCACGAAQLLFAALRLGRFASAVAPAVLHGMTAGIGLLLVLSQTTIVLGHKPQATAMHTLQALPSMLTQISWEAAGIGLLTAAVILIWPRLSKRLGAALPASLVGVSAGTLCASVLRLDVQRVQLPAKLLESQGLHLGDISVLSFVGAALSMALMASTESLLSAVALDKARRSRSDLDRELLGQGVGNIVSGMLGGLPIAGVIVRSTNNVQAGAKSRASAFLHGVWVLLAATFAAKVLAMVPLAALAALLMVTGARLVNLQAVAEVVQHKELPAFVVTLVGVVCINLLAGLALGIGVSVAGLFVHLARARVHVKTSPSDHRVFLTVEGVATFLIAPRLVNVLRGIRRGSEVHLRLPVAHMDYTVRDMLDTWRAQHEAMGGKIVVRAEAPRGRGRRR